jgi:hypothetical protein
MDTFLEFLTTTDFPYASNDFSAEACAARRAIIYELHPVDAVARAAELAGKFKDENDWCQKGSNTGSCLLAADELLRYLEPHHIRMTSVQFGTYNGHDHAWLEVLDKTSEKYYIIDPTADQFGDDIPEIVAGLMEELPQYQYEICD